MDRRRFTILLVGFAVLLFFQDIVQAHILDFGLAKTYLEGDKTVTISRDGDVAGTPAYMSPEQ